MSRKILSASRLRDELSRRIQRIEEIVDDGVTVEVPRPQWQAPDARGCNWRLGRVRNAAGYEKAIARVVEQAQAEFNLPEPGADAPTLPDWAR